MGRRMLLKPSSPAQHDSVLANQNQLSSCCYQHDKMSYLSTVTQSQRRRSSSLQSSPSKRVIDEYYSFPLILLSVQMSMLILDRFGSLQSLRVPFFTKIQGQIKNSDHFRFFATKRNRVPKGLFFVHFQRNAPQFLLYPGERITRFLTMLPSC